MATEETTAKEVGKEKPKEEESTSTFEPVVRSVLFEERVVHLMTPLDAGRDIEPPWVSRIGRFARDNNQRLAKPHRVLSTLPYYSLPLICLTISLFCLGCSFLSRPKIDATLRRWSWRR